MFVISLLQKSNCTTVPQSQACCSNGEARPHHFVSVADRQAAQPHLRCSSQKLDRISIEVHRTVLEAGRTTASQSYICHLEA
ncbi:hypothetical protein SESBI_17022 [Sesbania bispinosa]|nr:hypothetical protein SESBI_17022 [Sesbania bispinosa]